MDRKERKAAVAQWKERKPAPGIYALRCTASGETWVGRAADVDTVEARLRFTLRMASTPHRSLAVAARAHGEGAFAFEVLERLADDLSPELRDLKLKTRLEEWTARTGGTAI